MGYITQPGGTVLVCESPDWTGSGKPHLNVAVSKEALSAKVGRNMRWHIGQLYGVVEPGIIFAQHAFRGLKRPMLVGDDHEADEKKVVLTWAAKNDAYLEGDAFNAYTRFEPAPLARVFGVIVTVNEMVTDFPDVYAWAEHWSWLQSSDSLAGAPKEWQDAYTEKLWSSSEA